MKLLLLSQTTCGPCRALKPVLETVTDMLDLPYEVLEIDTQPEGWKIAEDYGIQSTPAVFLIKHNERIRINENKPAKLTLEISQYL